MTQGDVLKLLEKKDKKGIGLSAREIKEYLKSDVNMSLKKLRERGEVIYTYKKEGIGHWTYRYYHKRG